MKNQIMTLAPPPYSCLISTENPTKYSTVNMGIGQCNDTKRNVLTLFSIVGAFSVCSVTFRFNVHLIDSPFGMSKRNGACAHYVMVSKFQWKPFWLATQRDPQNDWTATQNRVNYDVFAHSIVTASLYAFTGNRSWLI